MEEECLIVKDVDIRIIPAGVQHLSEVMDTLPTNCVFDKGKVGCGGTTIALSNSQNYVIAVPYLVLIENKVAQPEFHEKVLGITGKTREEEILFYLDKTSVKKIMVTYESLPKLMGYINAEEYSILVDEYHVLFIQYLLRESAVKGVLENYQKFSDYCFMTATIQDDEHIIDELSHLPLVRAVWESIDIVTVHLIECIPNVYELVERLIKAFLDGRNEGNAYIFVNSLVFIGEMVSRCNLNNDNTRVIWGKSSKKGVGLTRGLSTDPPKKINLLTSTCFEGADFYDKEGRIYIVSDAKKAHTQIDISTAFRQIAGRIRDSEFKNEIYHIYNKSSRNICGTYEEYKEEVESEIASTKAIVNEYNNNLTAEARKRMAVLSNNFITKITTDKGEAFIFDPNKVRLKLFDFKKTHVLYGFNDTLESEFQSLGYSVIRHKPYYNQIKNSGRKTNNFRKTVEELKQLHDKNESGEENYSLDMEAFDTPAHRSAFEKYDCLEIALKNYGFEWIAEKGYNISNIKRGLIYDSDLSETDKILNVLQEQGKFTYGTFVSNTEIKNIFRDIYQNLNIKKNPKGTEIKKYYDVKEVKRKVGRGFVIKQAKHFIEA